MPLPDTFEELQSGGVMVFLPRHRARADHSLAKLHEVGFSNVVLEPGVDGASCDARRVAEEEGWTLRHDRKPGEVGLAVAMFRLWQRVVAEERPYLLVFEDDVLPHPEVAALGPAYLEHTPRDAEWVFLGNQMDLEPDQRDDLVVCAPTWTTHAYVVTWEGARKAMALLDLERDWYRRPLDNADGQLWAWMKRGVIRWACWNGSSLTKAYPTSDDVVPGQAISSDVVWSERASGVFYQNFALGSTIHDPDTPWRGHPRVEDEGDRGRGRGSTSATKLDVLVTCLAYDRRPVCFPQVRGYTLANHLAACGLKARFGQLPQPGAECQVVICADYQRTMEEFEASHLLAYLSEVRAERMFCMTDYSLFGRGDHFSRPYCEWFAERGGVLCHLPSDRLEPYETWIGLGVDPGVVGFDRSRRRDAVLFDFPRSSSEDASVGFDPATISIVRDELPGTRVVGSGPRDLELRTAFDAWVPYDQPHPGYVAAAYTGVFAFVPGLAESLGLAVAEAQMAGACIVSREGQVEQWALCPEAALSYSESAGSSRETDAASLVDAVRRAARRDPVEIREQAAERFDVRAVAARTREAVGL